MGGEGGWEACGQCSERKVAGARPVHTAAVCVCTHGPARPSKYGGSGEATGEDLRHALDCVLAGAPLDRRVVKSIGCNIKCARRGWGEGAQAARPSAGVCVPPIPPAYVCRWHPGKEPSWYG